MAVLHAVRWSGGVCPYWFHLSAVFLPFPVFFARTLNSSCVRPAFHELLACVGDPVLRVAVALGTPRRGDVEGSPAVLQHDAAPVPYSESGVNQRSETMRKRILAVTAATSLALGTLAGSALAHRNTAAGKPVGVPADVPGYLVGHSGMECGVQGGQLESLFPVVVCPADR